MRRWQTPSTQSQTQHDSLSWEISTEEWAKEEHLGNSTWAHTVTPIQSATTMGNSFQHSAQSMGCGLQTPSMNTDTARDKLGTGGTI